MRKYKKLVFQASIRNSLFEKLSFPVIIFSGHNFFALVVFQVSIKIFFFG